VADVVNKDLVLAGGSVILGVLFGSDVKAAVGAVDKRGEGKPMFLKFDF
jgi:hypothetical protein